MTTTSTLGKHVTGNNFLMTLSSITPLYSLMVTSPYIVDAIGLYFPVAYILGWFMSVLVNKGMMHNHYRLTSNGTVYSWTKNWWLAFIAGYCLIITGVISASESAFVAANTALDVAHIDNIWMSFIASGVLIITAYLVSRMGEKSENITQRIGLLVQVPSTVGLIYMLSKGVDFSGVQSHLSIHGLAYSTLLAMFAFWGFDTAYSLGESEEKETPARTARLSMIFSGVFFLVFTLSILDKNVLNLSNYPLLAVGVAASAGFSLGPIIAPTIHVLIKMGISGDIHHSFSSIKVSTAFSLVSSWIMTTMILINENIFADTVDAMVFFIVVYFAVSSWSAYMDSKNSVHLITVVIMVSTLAMSLSLMWDTDYGESAVGNIGSVFIITIILSILGAAVTIAVKALSHRKSKMLTKKSKETIVGIEDPKNTHP